MGKWFDDIIYFLTHGATPPSTSPYYTPPGTPSVPGVSYPAPSVEYEAEPDFAAKRLLLFEAGVLGAIVAAPALYAAYNARKGPKKRQTNILGDGTYLGLEGASNRAVSLLAALAPAFALPLTYITVQALEDCKYIRSGVGNTVQTVIVGGALAPAVGNIIGSVVSGVGKAAK